LSVPSAAIQSNLSDWMNLRQIRPEQSSVGLLSFLARPELVSEFCDAALTLFEADRENAARVMLAEDHGPELGHRDILCMEPVAKFVGRLEGEWLVKHLRKGSVENAFHPMVNPRTGQIEAYECLMRAVLPGGEIKSPAEMIGAARAAGILLHLDRVAQISAIQNAARMNISESVFVNFNPSTTCDPELCLRETVTCAASAGIEPSRIVFEVTESECVSDTRHLKKVLNFYRSQGFRIALDDLGSGYSSLNLLTEVRPDFVKLDMALIRGIDNDLYKQHVTRSLLEMSSCLGVRTVVEGVETDGEWAWATNHGADMIQGFYFAKPALSPPTGPDLATWTRAPISAFRRTA
jgi:EAL domain-containing protein (putative c-di-GMP-specific phosphodiesterase class I)